MNTHENTKGYFFSLIFCVAVALSSILIHSTNQLINPYLSVFLTFVICALWFNLVNINSLPTFYRKLTNDKRNFFIVNLVTAINWVTTFEALKYIDAVLYIALFMGLMPIATYLINSCLSRKKIKTTPILVSVGIISILSLIIYMDKKSLINMDMFNFYKGVVFTIISSIASSLYMVYSKKLESNLNLTTSQIVAVRFYLLIIYSGVICLGGNYFPDTNKIQYTNFLVLALISSIIPMYCVQKSITHIGVIKTSFIIPFTPVLTYLVLFFLKYEQSFLLFPLLILLTALLIYNSLYFIKKNANE